MEIIKINGATKPAITCNVSTLEECDERESSFLMKTKAKGKEGVAKELARLNTMKGGKMQPELFDWLITRIGLLSRVTNELKDEL